MDLFPWSDEYSVGVPEVDAQHKGMFALVNELHETMAAGKGKDALDRVIASLANYARIHFAAEERLMESCGYPRLSQHQEQHDTFTKKILDFQEAHLTGKIALSVDIMDFLKGWLRQHILGSDKMFSPYVIRRG
jgi:hemerythrin